MNRRPCLTSQMVQSPASGCQARGAGLTAIVPAIGGAENPTVRTSASTYRVAARPAKSAIVIVECSRSARGMPGGARCRGSRPTSTPLFVVGSELGQSARGCQDGDVALSRLDDESSPTSAAALSDGVRRPGRRCWRMCGVIDQLLRVMRPTKSG